MNTGLFTPGRIGPLILKNRIVMAPMGMGALTEPDGDWGAPVRAYFEARAKGGTGLITTQVVLVTRRFEPISQHMLDIRSVRHRESLHRIAEDAHAR